MAEKDKIYLSIGVLIIFIALLSNLSIIDIVSGYTIFGGKQESVTLEDIKDGVVLRKGSNYLKTPKELMGINHSNVFANIEKNVREVENQYKDTWREGKKVWIPEDYPLKKVSFYKKMGRYTEEIISQDLKVVMLRKDTWKFDINKTRGPRNSSQECQIDYKIKNLHRGYNETNRSYNLSLENREGKVYNLSIGVINVTGAMEGVYYYTNTGAFSFKEYKKTFWLRPGDVFVLGNSTKNTTFSYITRYSNIDYSNRQIQFTDLYSGSRKFTMQYINKPCILYTGTAVFGGVSYNFEVLNMSAQAQRFSSIPFIRVDVNGDNSFSDFTAGFVENGGNVLNFEKVLKP